MLDNQTWYICHDMYTKLHSTISFIVTVTTSYDIPKRQTINS